MTYRVCRNKPGDPDIVSVCTADELTVIFSPAQVAVLLSGQHLNISMTTYHISKGPTP